MAVMLDNYAIITLNVCTLDHLPHQLSSRRHLLDIAVHRGSHLGPLLTTQRNTLINQCIKATGSSVSTSLCGLFVPSLHCALDKCHIFMT